MPFDGNSVGVEVVLGLGALATLVSLVRSWGSFWDATLTSADRLLAIQISVFLIPPVVVLLHELGHAAAVWAVGAQVVDFSYGLFEGSVTAVGFISRGQSWFIALAGNLVSVVVGLALLAVGYRARRLRRPLRYVLITGGAVELVFALVAYPLLSLSTSFGDWGVIYDFSETPVLAGATVLVHVGLIVGLWRWWRSTVRRTLFALGYGEEETLAALERAVREAPGDTDARIHLANLFARHGDLGLSADSLDQAVAVSTDPVRLHLARARLALHRGRWNDAVMAARAGLQAAEGGVWAGDDQGPSGPSEREVQGPSGPSEREEELRQRLWANEGLALAQMERPVNALAAFEHVDEPVVDDFRVLYGRGVARLGAGDQAGGRADLQTVIERLPEGDPLRAWAEARLQGHAPPIAPMAGV